jgi:drug/metabolite transporter (DMT)-like permease
MPRGPRGGIQHFQKTWRNCNLKDYASKPLGKQLLGIFLVLVSAAAIAVVPTAAKFALESGSNTLTILTAKGIMGTCLIGLFVVVSGQSFKIDRSALIWCFLAGVSYSLMAYGYIGSISYMPISLAIPIYFTHPIIIVAIAMTRGKMRPSMRRFIFALAALIGITMVLAPDLAKLNITGVALALLASLAVCGMILFTDRAQKTATTIQVNFYMTAMTAVVFAIATAFDGRWLFPSNSIGWLCLVLSAVCATIGLLTFFGAFRYISPAGATMISNVEPLLSVILAVTLLGEYLSLWQWSGVLVVMAALIAFELPEPLKFAEEVT